MIDSAYSIDGRTFAFEAPLVEALSVGSYVRIVTAGDVFLGQLLDEAVVASEATGRRDQDGHTVKGRGTLLSRLGDDPSAGADRPAVFDKATVEPADPATVAAHLERSRGSDAAIELGALQGMPDVTAALHAGGFGRHTFLCGQSGSGKTYTLGVVLERLLLDTDIRIAAIDPNSDYVSLPTLRTQDQTGLDEGEYRKLSQRYQAIAAGIHVFGGEGSTHVLKARFGALSFEQQTMVLGIDPLTNADEYNAFVRIVRRIGHTDYSLDDVMRRVRASFEDDVRRLGMRIDNLGVADQTIWAGEHESVRDVLPDDWRMLVADIGSLPTTREGSVAAAGLLGFLWDARHRREPIIIVIDEAHNVCPQVPTDANQALATEHVVRIAGEGRKYGLYLLLATQRPAKVHQNVLSQCDNLLLMRMNSATDIATLAESFSFTPAALIDQAATFGLGEGLAAGKIAPDPLLFRSGRRLTVEGGADVSSSWAKA